MNDPTALGQSFPPPVFAEEPGRPRLAAGALQVYPAPGHEHALATADQLAAALSADCAWFHWRMPDPATLPPALRPRLGSGILAPVWDTSRREDLAHFASTEPERQQRLLQLLEPLRVGAEAQTVEFDLGMAWSTARWMKAWRADAAITFYPHTPSLGAAVAGALLEIPHVLWLGPWRAETPTPWHLPAVLTLATVVSVPDEASRAALGARFGAMVAAKALVRTQPNAKEHLASRLRDAMAARPANAPRRGPTSAFATRTEARAQTAATQLFAIVCAERTGSNLLVDLLARQRGIACVGELFNARFLENGRLPWFEREVPDIEALRQLRATDPGALLNRLRLEAERRGFAQVGLKLMYGHLVANNRLVDALLAEPNLRVVHLRREDRLGRLVSHLRAKDTDVWFRRQGSAGAPVAPVTLTGEQAAADFALLETFERRIAATFANYPLVEITYEELVRDPHRVLEQVSLLLGIQTRYAEPLLRKEAPAQPGAGVIGWGELRAAFAGTRWAKYFVGDPEPAGGSATHGAAENP